MVHFSRYLRGLVTPKQVADLQYRMTNAERVLERKRKYREANREKIREQDRQRCKKWREANPEASRAKCRKGAAARKQHRPLLKYESNARKAGRTYELTADQAKEIMSQPCHYCCFQGSPYVGMDRKHNFLGYSLSNAVPCCSQCNYAKRDMEYDDFWEYLQRITDAMNKRKLT